MTLRCGPYRLEIYLTATGVQYMVRADAGAFARARAALARIIGFAPQVEENESSGRLFVALDEAQHSAFGDVWRTMHGER